MNNQRLLVALSANLTFAFLVVGCGGYTDTPKPSATGGTATGGTATATGGTATATGGTAAATGGTAAATGGTATATGGTATATGGTATATGGAGGSQGGSGAGKASCTNVTACGGDVVGTWTVAASCLPVTGSVDLAGFGLGCTEAPVTGSLSVTGTWTAMAGGMYSDNTTTSGTEIFEVPATCLNVSGTITQCRKLNGPFQALGFSTVDCLDNPATSGCTCTATAQQMGGLAFVSLDASTSGNYKAESNVLTTTSLTETKYDYCVVGNTMTMSVQTKGKTGTLSGTIVLQK